MERLLDEYRENSKRVNKMVSGLFTRKMLFSSPGGSVPSDLIPTKFLRDHNIEISETGRTATAHGFRSGYRDWTSENGCNRDLSERVLAHTVRNQIEAAYHRTDLLEQRRDMMEAWSLYVFEIEENDKVLPFRLGGW